MHKQKSKFDQKWKLIRGRSLEWFDLLGEHDLKKVDKADDKLDKFMTVLQVKYGYTRQQARVEVTALENAELIYFSGGNPGYLYETMKDTRAWNAAQCAWARDAVYAGCSAGAMILGKRIPGFRLMKTQEGFGIFPAEYIIPHFDAFPALGKPMVFALQKALKDGQRMVGIDQDTALVGSLQGGWHVMGKSEVHVFTHDGKTTYRSGDLVPILQAIV